MEDSETNGRPVEAIQDDIQRPSATPETKSLPAKPTPTSTTSMHGIVDHALDFLAHASNETLGACFIGFGAATYMLLGRVGLVIMSVAGGVVLHATWEGIRGDNRDEQTKQADQEKRKETSLDIIKRTLNLRQAAHEGLESEDSKVYPTQDIGFSSFGPHTETALNAFVDAIIKDYVHYWYAQTLPGEESFPAACRRTLTAFLLSLSNHLRRKRPADVFLDFVTNASSIIIVFLTELSAALRASPSSPAEDAIAAYLELKPESSLAYMLDQRSQNIRLTDAAEDILQAYLDPKSYNCPPVQAFLKQILAQLVLGYTVSYCSKPDWINDYIVYGLEESETAKEVMDIVDAGVEGRHAPTKPKPEQTVMPEEPRVISKKEAEAVVTPEQNHRRTRSKAEEAMDEAMKEAQRLTQLMMEEDEKRRREQEEPMMMPTASGDVSDNNTQGIATPSSSQSGNEKEDVPVNVPGVGIETEEATTTSPQFTNFDQLVPDSRPTALIPERTQSPPVLTLHNASVNIFDDSMPGERSSIKAKPTTDFLIQIEPLGGMFPGWMIARKYADFETLHEVLRRISVVTGVPQFTSAHAELPKWKTQTKAGLRSELERYLTDAIGLQPLAESEGMKRFLEKDQAMSKSPGQKGFGWPTPDAFGKIGGDMMNVLTKAPKQVAGGVAGGGKAVLGGVAGSGKAVFGGVAGLVGNVANVAGGKKSASSQNAHKRADTVGEPAVEKTSRHKANPSLGQGFMTESYLGTMSSLPRESTDSIPSLRESKTSIEDRASIDSKPKSVEESARASIEKAPMYEQITIPESGEAMVEEVLNLPPRPSELPDDFQSVTPTTNHQATLSRSSLPDIMQQSRTSDVQSTPPKVAEAAHESPRKAESRQKPPLSDRETSVAVELMFAVITELYTLSSAWNIRRTLLSAAKTFLLRPGNPQLLSIKELLQTSLLDSNLSDEGLAEHIYKLRANTLPTTEELEIWARDYPEKTEEQKAQLRIKARKLLVTKGMPQALSSVMGAAASGEALGKVFDCLQIEHVSRGLIFGLLLQALRMITQ